MNGTPTSGFFSEGSNFAKEEPRKGILELAHDAFREFERASMMATPEWNPEPTEEYKQQQIYYATQSALLIGMSIAKDLRRIANALERRHV